MAKTVEKDDSRMSHEDLIRCPICYDLYDNPRSMPCLHTYCYKCLDGLCKDKVAGKDTVGCPICRREYVVPSGGVVGFAHNFFIQCMVDGNRPEAPQRGAVVCEACAQTNITATATKCCIDCHLRLCERCNRIMHRHQMSSGNHRIRENGAEFEREIAQLASSYCTEHANRVLELHCVNCNCNVCVSCVAQSHSEHKVQKTEEVASSFTGQMRADPVAVARRSVETLQQECQTSALQSFCDGTDAIANAVGKQCRDLKSYLKTVIDNGKQKVLQVREKQALKRFSENGEQDGLSLVSMTSAIDYVEELRSKGQRCDLTRAEIHKQERVSQIPEELTETEVYNGQTMAFQTDNSHKVVDNSDVGHPVATDEDTDGNTHVIANEDCKDSVTGLTVHCDELFIVRCWPESFIEVYNATNFTFERKIKVNALERGGVNGLTSCDVNSCLYVSHWYCYDSYIVRVELTGNNEVVKWKLKKDSSPQGLSKSNEHNLLVACGRSRKLIEYTTRGELVREIVLQDEIVNPQHAIQLNNSQFLVSNGSYSGDSQHQVCVVDANGRVLLSYGNKPGSETGQLNAPQQLAVCSNGCIYVADCDNNRIVVLDSTLQWSRDLRFDGGSGVNRPCSLYFDEKRKLLFVGEVNGDASRVVVVTV